MKSKLLIFSLTIFFILSFKIGVSFGWDNETLNLLNKFGERNNFGNCDYLMGIVKQLNKKEGNGIYPEIFERMKSNFYCMLPFGLLLLKEKNQLAVDALIFHMNPSASESVSEDANYDYYWEILAKLSNGQVKPERTIKRSDKGFSFEFNVYPIGSWEKISKWWEENKNSYKFPLSDAEIRGIFKIMKENTEKSNQFYKKVEQETEKRPKEKVCEIVRLQPNGHYEYYSHMSWKAVMVSAGRLHTCALSSTGGVKCWGDNTYDELGIGSHVKMQNTPVDVVGLNSGVTAISAGGNHTCALTSSGGVKCWGKNSYGELGDGSIGSSKNTPEYVVGLSSGVTAISAGDLHTCALTSAGGVKCWGDNKSGQLGNGSFEDAKNTPVDVVGLSSGVTAISAGDQNTCALTSAGGMKCWGNNIDGHLGNGSFGDKKNIPVDVVGLNHGVISISSGSLNTCALISPGRVKCWGYYRREAVYGGAQEFSMKSTPTNIAHLGSGIIAISAGQMHSCALTSKGSVKCWGGEFDYYDKVAGLNSGVTAITVGGYHTCILTSAGIIKCWGDNESGELGNGGESERNGTLVEVVDECKM